MNDTELIQWLRENSSGNYRPSLQAADRLEELAAGEGKPPYLKLEEGEQIIGLDGIITVYPLDEPGSSWNQWRFLCIEYQNGKKLRISYGSDINREAFYAARRDKDFKQVLTALIPS